MQNLKEKKKDENWKAIVLFGKSSLKNHSCMKRKFIEQHKTKKYETFSLATFKKSYT